MSNELADRLEAALSKIRVAAMVIGNLPELPGYNGSILQIDDTEAERIERDLYAAVIELGAIAALRSEPVAEVAGSFLVNWLPYPRSRLPIGTKFYAAPSRESRTDRQEPGLSAETINRAKWLHEQVHERLDDKSLREEDWIRYKANLEHIYKEHFPALCDMALRSLTAPTVSEKGEQDADELLREVLDWGLPDDLKQRIDAHLARKEQK